MANPFKKAVKTACKLRLAIIGPSGAGKTFTSLRMATALGKRIALIDTEKKSASKYAKEFDFDVLNLAAPYHPERYMEAIRAADREGYDVCIVDSLSHMWTGKGGILQIVEDEAKRSKSGNTFNAWSKGTPLYNDLIDCLLGCNMHLIGTMRSKSKYVIEQNERGKSTPKKVGTEAIQREGFEFEFDIVMDMTADNEGIIQKTRCSSINGQLFTKPGEDFAAIIKDWLEDGAPEPPKPVAASPEQRALGNKVGTLAMQALLEYREEDGKQVEDKFATVAAIKATLADWHKEDPSCCSLNAAGEPAINACTMEQLQGLEKRFQDLLNAVTSAATAKAEKPAKSAPKAAKAEAKAVASQDDLPFGATPEAVGQSDPWGEDDEGRWSSYGDGEVEREPVEMG